MTREEAIKGLKVLAKDFSGYRPNEEMFNMAIEALEQLSSAQPIIRCKDCKHSFLHDNGEKISRICGLTRMCGTTPDDWFCADAEKREE